MGTEINPTALTVNQLIAHIVTGKINDIQENTAFRETQQQNPERELSSHFGDALYLY